MLPYVMPLFFFRCAVFSGCRYAAAAMPRCRVIAAMPPPRRYVYTHERYDDIFFTMPS